MSELHQYQVTATQGTEDICPPPLLEEGACAPAAPCPVLNDCTVGPDNMLNQFQGIGGEECLEDLAPSHDGIALQLVILLQ